MTGMIVNCSLMGSKYGGLDVSELVRVKDQGLTIKRSYQLVNLSRVAYYQEKTSFAVRDAPAIEALNSIVAKHGRGRFWECHVGRPWWFGGSSSETFSRCTLAALPGTSNA